MSMKPTRPADRERLMLVITVARDPRTQRFFIEASDREDWGALVPIMKRDGSPTRFAASVADLSGHALRMFLAEIARKWGDVLERELVDVAELADIQQRPMG